MARRTVVLGAGFAGLEAAIRLAREFRNAREVEIILLGEQNYFLFTPLLPQIASSYIEPRHIVQTLRDIRGRQRFAFRRDTVRAIAPGRHTVELASESLEYDYLIVALGSRADFFNIPGAREHTWDFKTLEDAVVLRERMIDLCEHADHTADAAARRRMLTFVVVGGGYTGVELITELQNFLFRYVAPRYQGIPRREIRPVLLEAAQQILTGIHPSLARHAQRRLAVEGIEIRYGARVTRCFDGGVEINGSKRLEAETVMWAAGVRAHELVEALPGPHDRLGRALVNDHLQLEDVPEVFVAGDSAAALSAREAPRIAPVAISQGQLAARNVAHRERGEPLESYRYVPEGMLVSLGMNYAVVNLGRLRFHGYLAWLLWNAVHLYKLVGFKKQVQVALDWWLGQLFPRDAAIIRKPQRCRICGTLPGERAAGAARQ
jgi:NADH dehydrogenase